MTAATFRQGLRMAVMGALALGLAGAAWAASTGRCGGEGGDRRAVIRCPEGQFIIGVGGRGGAFLNSISIRCAPFDNRGKRGTPQRTWLHGGAEGGSGYREGLCRGDRAVDAIKIRSGAYVDRITRITCVDMTNPVPNSRENKQSVEIEAGNSNPTPAFCDLQCPTGEALFQLTVRYGGWMDSVTGQCRPRPEGVR